MNKRPEPLRNSSSGDKVHSTFEIVAHAIIGFLCISAAYAVTIGAIIYVITH